MRHHHDERHDQRVLHERGASIAAAVGSPEAVSSDQPHEPVLADLERGVGLARPLGSIVAREDEGGDRLGVLR